MRKKILILALLLGSSACQSDAGESSEVQKELPFDSAKWNEKDGYRYRYRERMLPDLLEEDTLKKLNQEGIVHLLGKPTRTDSLYLFYRVSEKRLGLWPVDTRTLVIKMKDSENVEWIKIHE